MLDNETDRQAFNELQTELWNAIKVETEATGEMWPEAHFWFVDRMVYTFLNRLFAIRVMEALDLLGESTLVPQADLGNRSARMARIQEQNPGKNMFEWLQLVLRDVFAEIGKDVRILFDESDIASIIWPSGQIIEQLVHQLNTINPELYKASDIIGWFYHYYVLKIRKGHKTMSSHGSKSPANPNYLSILNTVYTPRWMVRVLIDNSLGNLWREINPESRIFTDSPYYIRKGTEPIINGIKDIVGIRILDPACGSGNFLVYSFEKLVDMYLETFPDWPIIKIVTSILSNNIFGIDINRRPAQLSAFALFIAAKKIIKTRAPDDLTNFKSPIVNVICCDIRIPHDKNEIIFSQKIKDPRIQKLLKDIVERFNDADQLGFLIDIKGIQEEINRIQKDIETLSKKNPKLDSFIITETSKPFNLPMFLSDLLEDLDGNIGIQIFGQQAKNAATLASLLLQNYDLIMGNPPFGLTIEATKLKLKSSYPDSYNDLVSAFIDQSLRHVKINGYVAMVTDFSFLHLPKFENFRAKIFLAQTYIQSLIIIGLNALPDARNYPALFVIRKVNHIDTDEFIGLYRELRYQFNKNFADHIYRDDLLNDIQKINSDIDGKELPPYWCYINQNEFFTLPRYVIDLSISTKLKPILELFVKYPGKESYEDDSQESKIVGYDGFNTGRNEQFIRYWFETQTHMIREAIGINSDNELPSNENEPFIPYSKGGGDIRYYLSNGFILWWTQNSLLEMKKLKGSRIFNLNSIGKYSLIAPVSSGRSRCRINVAQKGIGMDGVSIGFSIVERGSEKFSIMAYLNSKLGAFFGRILMKDRKWRAGIITRIPLPLEMINLKQEMLKSLSKESFELRRDWDTTYPMSPIFSNSLLDSILGENALPNTGHPFCKEYTHCESETSLKIGEMRLEPKTATIQQLLKVAEERFNILTNRLDEIDETINNCLCNDLLDYEAEKALNEYFDKFVGVLYWKADPEKWIKDFLMANIILLIKNTPKGIVTLKTFNLEEKSLYEELIDLLCIKFDRKINDLQSILNELEKLFGKDLEHWIAEDFFFYHVQRFGGRPIIWQFSSRSKSKKENAIDLFVDYSKLTENSLPNIRVTYLAPLIRSLEQRKLIGTLPKDDVPVIDELEDLYKAFSLLETGNPNFPTPNQVTGKNTQKGKGDDKTWEWVFNKAANIVKDGYRPDLSLGVLINILPLCIDLENKKQISLALNFKAICPKGTLKHVLKKIALLDQLCNVGSNDSSDEDEIDQIHNAESMAEIVCEEGLDAAKKEKIKKKRTKKSNDGYLFSQERDES
jgi:hypothetical protein